MTKEATKSRPTHRVYAVTKNGEKKFWQPIGAMWAIAGQWLYSASVNPASVHYIVIDFRRLEGKYSPFAVLDQD